MPLTEAQLNNIHSLISSPDRAFMFQGIELADLVIDDPSDFEALCQKLHPDGKAWTKTSTVEDALDFFDSYPADRKDYLALWAFSSFAKWDEFIAQTDCLDLSSLKLTHLPSAIGNLIHLKEFYIDNYSLVSLPNDLFKSLTRLEWLSIRKVKLQHIPSSVQYLSNLQGLIIIETAEVNDTDSGIDEHIGGITELPEWIGMLTQLYYLDLNFNSIERIPESFGQLTGLQVLKFNANCLSEFPTCLLNLTDLRELNLQWNRLTSVPALGKTLTELEYVNLAYNQIAEPPSIEGLTQLHHYTIANNPCSPYELF